MPKPLCKQSKQLIVSLIAYFEAERDNNGPLLPLTAVRERVANAVGIHISTINKISSVTKQGTAPTSPKRKRLRSKAVVNIDILSNIGFHYKKDDPKRALMKVPHITLKRVSFLQQYIRMKHENICQFVFLDETWIFQDGTIGKSWQNECAKSVKATKVGGKRYIVVHAGNADGFIPGAELVFSTNSKDMDYHGDMNRNNFLYWFEHQLLMNLKNPSVIVMDNASYHSTITNKSQTSSTTKLGIQQWLTNHNINYENTALKIQLLDLVERYKSPPIYEADELAEKYGHVVLRLPPYHCIFNPIELVWGTTKQYYANHVGKYGRSEEDCIKLWREA